MSIDLARLARPNTVSIFADDPTARGAVIALIIENVAIPDRLRVRLDLSQSGAISRRYAISRSPLERATTDAIRREPLAFTIAGTLSATPLGAAAAVLGSFGSFIRRDLRERDKLTALADRREPVILVTPWTNPLDSMAIAGIDESHGGGNKVDLTIAFEEIRIVDPLTVRGVTDLDTLLAGAPDSVELGPQPIEQIVSPADLAGGGLGV